MKVFLKIFVWIIAVILLTVLTQIGGIVLLSCIPFFLWIKKKGFSAWKKRGYKVLIFMAAYTVATIVIVPLLAPLFGREALPIFSSDKLKPLTYGTCFFNRHYVTPELKEVCINVADKMNEKYPNTVVAYMDANFPFIDEFPLLPHLSHNDGEKIDIAFFYTKEEKTLQRVAPTFLGYGGYEYPLTGEEDKPEFCHQNGYFQYSFTAIFPVTRPHLSFDEERTKVLTQLFLQESAIQKIFIEPHLKARLGLWNDKVRFHGCGAVRHDDHIHVQL
ncbi:MAG: hypothetical protein ACPG4Z_02735 [Chitinophagales bacterium]